MRQGKRLGRGASITLGLLLLALLAADLILAARDGGSLLPGERTTEAVTPPADGPADVEAVSAAADPGPRPPRLEPEPATATAADPAAEEQPMRATVAAAGGEPTAPPRSARLEREGAPAAPGVIERRAEPAQAVPAGSEEADSGEPGADDAPAYKRWARALAAMLTRGGRPPAAPALERQAVRTEADVASAESAAAAEEATPASGGGTTSPSGIDLDAVVAALTDDELLTDPSGTAAKVNRGATAEAAAGDGEEIDLEALVAALKADDWAVGGVLASERGTDAEAVRPGAAVGEDKARALAEAAPGWSEDDRSATASPGRRAPTFDIVRVAPDGRAVIAGRAEPGEVVEIRVDERVVDRVEANRRGQWVSLPVEPLTIASGEMTLRSLADGAPPLSSEQVVVLALPQRRVATAGRGDDSPGGAGAGGPGRATTAAAEATPQPRQALAVLLPKEGTGAGRLLQAPGGIRAGAGLALRVLDYDHLGRVRLVGDARPGATVRVYIDGAPTAEAQAGEDGAWLAHLERRLAPGTYALRVEQVDADGKVLAQLETPFSRAAALPPTTRAGVDHVIVQPGNSLWRIARRVYGEGFQYVHIYDANRNQIQDPDLIYPGQIFGVPPLD